ncbi:hypothetical protein SMSRO_SF029730 [Spiroplasma poulsonii]|uniref:Uncharacterized protein n=1 Tax=Spiroplasma poulsonii TaxID=2138 RepID=A0A2P6F8M6_9MOLU|nr:hypothetical protein SMSRO_SF029730 [Spiroplasma poulsonii]
MGLTRIPVPIDKRFNLKLMNEAFDLALIEQILKMVLLLMLFLVLYRINLLI